MTSAVVLLPYVVGAGAVTDSPRSSFPIR
jgi:hypothetical protein